MLQKILRVSSLAFVLAGVSISAHAGEPAVSGNEEDLAAVHGSFTSGMTAPMNGPTARMERAWRHFAMRVRDGERHMRQPVEYQR
jgi:hypothetical protein